METKGTAAYSQVTLRNKKSDRSDVGNSHRLSASRAYVQRPRSWGEFQTNLTLFNSVNKFRPSSTSTDAADNVMKSANGSQRKPSQPELNISPKEKLTAKVRPLSEVAVVTPFYKPFRATPNSDFHVRNNALFTGSSAPLSFFPIRSKSTSTDLRFGSAEDDEKDSGLQVESDSVVESASADVTEASTDSSVESAAGATNAVAENADRRSDSSATCGKNDAFVLQAKNVEQPPGAMQPLDRDDESDSCFASAGEGSDLQVTCNPNASPSLTSESSRSESGDDSSSRKHRESNSDFGSGSSVEGYTPEVSEAALHPSVIVKSDVSEERGSLDAKRETADASASSSSDAGSETEMPNNNSPSAAPRKPQAGIPTTLRSCYNQTYELKGSTFSDGKIRVFSVTSKSSLSSSSVDFSDEENTFGARPPLRGSRNVNDSGTGGYDGDRSAEDTTSAKSTRSRPLVPTPRSVNRASRSSASSGGSEIENSRVGVKGILRNRGSDLTRADSGDPRDKRDKSADRYLGWKDGEHASVDFISGSDDRQGDAGQGMANGHGTWPGRRHTSRRKQDQEEAEELLRKFRETSEAHRIKFRNIYAETRRRVEEAMFGLRVSMAKNGYSAKRYQAQYDARHFMRDAKT